MAMTSANGSSHVTRRRFIQIGSMGLLGVGLSNQLSWQTNGERVHRVYGVARRVILLFLQGGPSHIDIWDPKPDAPSNVRGEFAAIRTNVPGILLSETMPLLARHMDKCALIRSMSYTPRGIFSHDASIYEALTGFPAVEASPSGEFNLNNIPTFGSRLADRLPDKNGAPASIEIGTPAFQSCFGSRQFQIQTDSAAAQDQDTDSSYDQGQPEIGHAPKTWRLSPDVRQALKLNNEEERVRRRYGYDCFGQSVLLARRLVEAGVHFVQVNWPSKPDGNPETGSWDTHRSNFRSLRQIQCPRLDAALTALLCDLDSRGLLQETMVVVLGEFGRSPRIGVSTSGAINFPDGRDHWPFCFSALVAGAGIQGGQVYGASDQTGSFPRERPVHPRELIAMVRHALGVRPRLSEYTNECSRAVTESLLNTLWS